MGSRKLSREKRILAAELKHIKPVPIWVVARTRGRVRTSPARRFWRRTRIKL